MSAKFATSRASIGFGLLVVALASACPSSSGDACDADGDGWQASACGGDDCDDEDASIHPEAVEVCQDGMDNNCDGHAKPCGLTGKLTSELADATIDYEGDGFSVPSLVSVGDWDGDGLGDIAIGNRSGGGGGMFGPGRVWVHRGPFTATVEGADAFFIVRAGQDVNVGSAVEMVGGLGEANQDYLAVYSESLVESNEWGGAVGFFARGQPGAMTFSETPALVLGVDDVATITDQMGSGQGPAGGHLLLVTGPSTSGLDQEAVRILDQLPGPAASAADQPVLLDNDFVGAESQLALAHLLLADGREWLFVGQEEARDLGWSGVVIGFPLDSAPLLASEAPLRILGSEAHDFFGDRFAIGDLDDDGVADLVTAAFRNSSAGHEEGAVYLYFGVETGAGWSYQNSTTVLPDRELLADEPAVNDPDGWAFGGGLAVGDFNADGSPELVVGAPGAWPGTASGCTYIYDGPLDRSIGFGDYSTRICGSLPGEAFGIAISTAGDTDGDGYDDLLIASLRYVYLFRGGPGW